MATAVDLPASDPFVDHLTEWSGRAHPGAYDLVAVVGALSPAVVALAVLAEAAVICLPVGPLPLVAAAVDDALVQGRVDVVPVAQVVADGHLRFTVQPVTVVPESDAVVTWLDGTVGQRLEGAAFEFSVTPAPGGTLELRLPGRHPLSCRRVELSHVARAVRIDLDGRSRRVGRVAVEGLASGLRILRVAEGS